MSEQPEEVQITPKASKVKKSEALWLMTFSDLSFVLLCFFVLMFSFTSTDAKKFDNVRDAMSAKTSDIPPPASEPTNLKEVEQEIQEIITENNLQQVAEVTFDAKGVAVEFKDHALFRSGSARINPKSEKLIGQVLKAIAHTPKRYRLEIEGHTDDVPIHTRHFRDNWELSSQRAISLLRRFNRQGVGLNRMSVQAFAQTQPKVPFQGKKGPALHQARAQNRRVVIRIR